MFEFKLVTELLNTAALLAGAYFAYKALGIYKNKMQTAAKTSLEDLQRDVQKGEIEKPYIQALYAYAPKGISDEDYAHNLIKLIIEYQDHTEADQNYKNPKWIWDSAEDLDRLLFEDDGNFYHPAKTRLRECYFHMESILYIISIAYSAKSTKTISDKEWKIWKGFFDTLGYHPLFILSIRFAKDHNLIYEEFYVELCSYFKGNEIAGSIAKMMYPDLLK